MTTITNTARPSVTHTGARLEEAAALYEQAERELARAAREAHRSGWTWEQIGQALGITRQTASARYSERPAH